MLGANPAVDLVACVREEVEARGRVALGERVRACSDGLSAQRFRMPARRHLPRHDAAQVSLERQAVHDDEGSAAAIELELAAISVASERNGRCAGDDSKRRS